MIEASDWKSDMLRYANNIVSKLNARRNNYLSVAQMQIPGEIVQEVGIRKQSVRFS